MRIYACMVHNMIFTISSSGPYVGECRMGLHYHVSCGQGARVGVPLLGLDLLRFDDHLRNAIVLHHSLH